MALFPGFELTRIDCGDATLRVRIGGTGPPVLLLHGHPQTHVMWHRVAPLLADAFTVVCPDLRGYGESSKPPTTDDHEPYSKRAMARDFAGLMTALGFETFSVAGHDRGGRVAYRLALDHPDRIDRLAVFDVVPTGEAWARADWCFVLTNPHWGFMAEPYPRPERVIGADPDAYYYAGDVSVFDPEALEDYRRCARDPETIHGMCEDYRAGAAFDRELDWSDKAAGRRVGCPVLVLWAGKDELGEWYDPLAVWREWADDVSGRALDSGHFLAEERPDKVAAELKAFF